MKRQNEMKVEMERNLRMSGGAMDETHYLKWFFFGLKGALTDFKEEF